MNGCRSELRFGVERFPNGHQFHQRAKPTGFSTLSDYHPAHCRRTRSGLSGLYGLTNFACWSVLRRTDRHLMRRLWPDAGNMLVHAKPASKKPSGRAMPASSLDSRLSLAGHFGCFVSETKVDPAGTVVHRSALIS